MRLLLDRGPRKDLDDLVRVDHVIEMGCGTALPSMLLFQYALRNRLTMYFTLTDYNLDVLRLVTLPNLVLNWAASLTAEDSARAFADVDGGNPLADVSAIDLGSETQMRGSGDVDAEETSGELFLTPALLAAFQSHLSSQGLTLTLLSGSWTPIPAFLDLIPSAQNLNTFLLASETIYSPASLHAFTHAMAALLKRVSTGKALVAAKRVYFGVGGSVDAFRIECSGVGCVAGEVEWDEGELGSGGVRRGILEVQVC